MNKVVEMRELVPVIRELVEKGREVSFSPKGDSMLPMLSSGKDTVVLVKSPKKLKKYDLPLYRRRKTDTYVLHRVISVRKDGTYVMRGDNQYIKEPGVKNDDIVAVVKSFTHKGKSRSVNDFSYRVYCFFRVKFCSAHLLYRRLRSFLGRLARRFFKK